MSPPPNVCHFLTSKALKENEVEMSETQYINTVLHGTPLLHRYDIVHNIAMTAPTVDLEFDIVVFRDESSTTHNSTHFLTCVVYVLCICKPKTDMCGHVCHMSTQLFKKCVSKLCIFTEFNQK